MEISSPCAIWRSRSQQNPSFGFGPGRTPVPRLGSLDGSGKDARWVGGGLDAPATDPGAEGRWFVDECEVVRDKTGERVGVAKGERDGEVEKGFVASSMVIDRWRESWNRENS